MTDLTLEQRVAQLIGAPPESYPHGRCEALPATLTTYGCGRRGYWMWGGKVLCRTQHGPRCGESEGCWKPATVRITPQEYVDTKGTTGTWFFACARHGRKYGSPGQASSTGWIVEQLEAQP